MKKLFTFLLLSLLGILFLCCGCEAKDAGTILCQTPSFQAVLEHALPDHDIVKDDLPTVNDILLKGTACEVMDVQAVPWTELAPSLNWYPEYLATVVIAVDRAQTDAEIHGWQDLIGTAETVSYSEQKTFSRCMMATLSHALGDDSYLSRQMLDYLQSLSRQSRLVIGKPEAPIWICFDYEAAAQNQAGRQLEIIVPEEGTLSFQVGLLSTRPLSFPETFDNDLLQAGFRLTDGRSAPGLYPDAGDYARAETVTDYSAFNRDTERYGVMLRRQVLHLRPLSSVDEIEHQLFAVAFITLVIFWLGVSLRQILRPDIRRLLLISGIFMICWVLLRLVKYQLPFGPLSRCCWYSYYIFQLSIPLLMLWLAMTLDDADKRVRRIWKIALLILYGALILLILTNDLHLQAFIPDESLDTLEANYHYGWVYYLAALATFLPLFASAFLLVRKAWVQRYRTGALFPVIFGILILLYVIGYAANVSFLRSTDLVIMIGIFFLLYYESAMLTSLIPLNRKYESLFFSSPLKMQIVDDAGTPQFLSASSRPLSGALWEEIRAAGFAPVEPEDGTLIHTDPIPGGAVVWEEDVREIRKLQQQIRENVSRMQAANSILSLERDRQAARIAAEEETRLMTLLEKEIRAETDRLLLRIRTLPEEPDQQLALGKITLLLCFIKRRCNFFFREREGLRLPAGDLAVYLDELAEFSQYVGVCPINTCHTEAQLSPRQATLFYTFFYAVVIACMNKGGAKLLAQLLPEENDVVLQILPSVTLTESMFLSDELKSEIALAGGSTAVKPLDDTAGIRLRFPKGGAADA